MRSALLKTAVLALLFAGTAVFLQAESIQKKILYVEKPFGEILKNEVLNLSRMDTGDNRYVLSSLPLKQGEKPVLAIRTGAVPPEYYGIPFAVDGVCLIVHKNNPVTTVSAEELAKILKNRFTCWPKTGVPVKDLCFVHGTADAAVMREAAEEKDHPFAMETSSAAAAEEIVSVSETAIGILPLTAAATVSGNVRILAVDGVLPTPEHVLAGKYPGARTLSLQVSKDAPPEIMDLYRKLRRADNTMFFFRNGIFRIPATMKRGKKNK